MPTFEQVHHFFLRWIHYIWPIFLGGFVVSLVVGYSLGWPIWVVWLAVFFCALVVVPFTIWWMWLWCALGWRAGISLTQAFEPIPTPIQIAQALYDEWGRPPSAEEIQVVQTALIHRRNQGLLLGGLTLGGLYLISTQ